MTTFKITETHYQTQVYETVIEAESEHDAMVIYNSKPWPDPIYEDYTETKVETIANTNRF